MPTRISELSDAAPELARYRTGDRLDAPARYIEIGPRCTEKWRFSVHRAVVSMYLAGASSRNSRCTLISIAANRYRYTETRDLMHRNLIGILASVLSTG